MQRLVMSLLPGLLVASLFLILIPGDEFPQAPFMGAIMALMAVWWIQDIIPIPVTSLLPVFLFPMAGIMDVDESCLYYGRPIIFLFLGGFILALGLQASGVHKRIALVSILKIGIQPRRLVLGFMLVTGCVRRWISNTASTMVMLPIALSVIPNVSNDDNSSFRATFGLCLMLGIAYAANIGGMATLIGTPPNLIFLEMYHELFPDRPQVGFTDWMIIGLPIASVFLMLGWYILTRYIFHIPNNARHGGTVGIAQQLNDLGPMRKDEKRSLGIFTLAAILWITGSDIQLGQQLTIHGWRYWTGFETVNDAAVAVVCACLLFIVPSGEKEKSALLQWEATKELPWGILLLFGGGFALAGGFDISGLSNMIEEVFTNLPSWPPLLIMAIVCVFVTFQTEITSNSAVTSLLLPILASGALALGIEPKLLMISATLCASCAFMMPIATPPQAIVYGSGYVSIKQMMKAGIWFNLLGLFITISFFSLFSRFLW